MEEESLWNVGKGPGCRGGYRNTVRACRDGTGRSKAHVELHLAREVTAKKGFCKAQPEQKEDWGKCVAADE